MLKQTFNKSQVILIITTAIAIICLIAIIIMSLITGIFKTILPPISLSALGFILAWANPIIKKLHLSHTKWDWLKQRQTASALTALSVTFTLAGLWFIWQVLP